MWLENRKLYGYSHAHILTEIEIKLPLSPYYTILHCILNTFLKLPSPVYCQGHSLIVSFKYKYSCITHILLTILSY